MSMTRQEEQAGNDKLKAEINEGLQKLEDTFPDDFRPDAVKQRVAEFLEQDTYSHLQLAALYVQWACSHPSWIATDGPTSKCSCPEESGWVFLEDDPNSVRPCIKCNRDAYDALFGESNE